MPGHSRDGPGIIGDFLRGGNRRGGGIPHSGERYNVCPQWCRDTPAVTRVRHHLFVKGRPNLRNNRVTVQWPRSNSGQDFQSLNPGVSGQRCFYCKMHQKVLRIIAPIQQKIGLKNGNVVLCYGFSGLITTTIVICQSNWGPLKSQKKRKPTSKTSQVKQQKSGQQEQSTVGCTSITCTLKLFFY